MGDGETLGQAWDNFFSENPVTSFLQEFGFVDPSATQGDTAGQAIGVAAQPVITDVQQAVSGAIPKPSTLIAGSVILIVILVLILLILGKAGALGI